MRARLLGAISEGSGAINEDACGLVGDDDDVRAAWVLDGVTGINDRQYLSGTTDAHWLVMRADHHLRDLASRDAELLEICSALVDRLTAEIEELTAGRQPPPGYDPPAACIVLAKRYRDRWHVLRLGDSCLVYRRADRSIAGLVPDNTFDRRLAEEAEKLRTDGVTNVKDLIQSFRPRLLESRARRNKPGGYGILECSPACIRFAETSELDSASQILLCTDGFYRAVDHYALHTDESLLDACAADGGVQAVLRGIRDLEAGDRDCRRFPRLKPADDATAISLLVAGPSY